MREHQSQFLKDGQGVHTTFTPVLQEPRFPGGPSSLLSSPPCLCPIRLASLPAASNLNHPSVYYISFLSFTSITGAAADVPTPCFAESLSDSITFYVPIGWHAPGLSPRSPCSAELRAGFVLGVPRTRLFWAGWDWWAAHGERVTCRKEVCALCFGA